LSPSLAPYSKGPSMAPSNGPSPVRPTPMPSPVTVYNSVHASAASGLSGSLQWTRTHARSPFLLLLLALCIR
jgi:hypothetical protein